MAPQFLTSFGRAFIPKKFRPHLRFYFEKAGIDEVPYYAFGLLFLAAALITYLFYLTQILPAIRGLNLLVQGGISFTVWVGVMLSVVFVFGGFTYFILNMRIFHRTKDMEEKLPDYLTLVNTSLKGGYSFEKALWAAIKPEFGILAREVGLVSKRVMTGSDVIDALDEFSRKYDSPILRRALNLITGELESGGKVVEVIDRVILDLKKAKALKQEMAASTLTYMIFISALVMFVMPLLFSLSFVLFTIITGFIGDLTSRVGTGGAASTPLKLTKPSIDPDDYKVFIFLAITIISGSASLIVSIIERGETRAGLKYLPLFVISSLFVYFVCLRLLTAVFGGLFA